jgi:hypothetical protein
MPPPHEQQSNPVLDARARVTPKVFRVWHPVLIGLTPVLSAYLPNRHQVDFLEAAIPTAITLVLTLATWAMLAWALKDVAKAALPVSVFLLCFFHFDTVDDFVAGWTKSESVPIAMWVGLLASIVVLGAGVCWIIRRPRAVRVATAFLNAFSVLVLGMTVAMMGSGIRGQGSGVSNQVSDISDRGTGGETGVVVETAPNPGRLPDIYYIILDAYGRSDVLQRIYGFDNREFLNRLKAKGFVVPSRSTSNYCQTYLSLSSSLNCRHLDWLAGTDAHGEALLPALRYSTLLATLQHHGYRFVSFATSNPDTDFPDADVYLSPAVPRSSWDSEFEVLLLDKTPLRLRSRISAGPLADDFYSQMRQRTLFTFDSLGNIARRQAPKFVFAHVISPHPPFVFGENGEDVSPRSRFYLLSDGSIYQQHYGKSAEYVPGYRSQVTYITRRVEQAIDAILTNSREPPIIILQGDHGPGSRWNCDSADPRASDVKERMSILNAYYLPGGGDKAVYDSITPVNSFRIVLNHYFGAKLDLLADENYLSTVNSPFQFVKVTDQVR